VDRQIYLKYGIGRNTRSINYGTHVSTLNEATGNDRSIEGGPIKLLKIHGSLNWLRCPSCNQLYVNLETKIGITEYGLANACKNCQRVFRTPDLETSGLKLEPQIIYPTFLKDLSSVHFQRIWEYAADEISETQKLVFIGYSFPQADFEIRQLLARKVPDNCKIYCVLGGTEPREDQRDYLSSAKARYKAFFGKRELEFFYCGAREFITNHLRNL
jgi:hypothetical protein